MTFKNNRAPLLSIIKLHASFHHHMWIQTRVTVRKRLSWVLTSVTLTFDLWPWPFAWTSLLSLVITPENFMMIWWWEHGEKGVTDRRTDGQTDRQTDGLNQSYSCLVAAKKSLGTHWNYSQVNATELHQRKMKQTIAWDNGFVQDCSNSIANSLELLQTCTKPSIYVVTRPQWVLSW